MADIYGDKKKNGAKAQWEKLKDAPVKDKVQYIVTYYGIAILVAAILIWMATSLIRGIIYNSYPNVVAGEFYTYGVDTNGVEELRLELCEGLGLEEKKYHIDISGTALSTDNTEQYYYQIQKLVARLSTKDVDFIVAPKYLLDNYMDNEDTGSCAFIDIRTLLSEETFQKLEEDGRVLYFEMSTGEKVPYAIDINNTYITDKLQVPNNIENYLGCCVNSENPEGLSAFIDLIYKH